MSDATKIKKASDKRKMKVYISGPMTGLPDLNRKAFNKAEEWCRKKGLSPFNPAWLNFEDDTAFAYDEILQMDLKALSLCDAILLLPGYEKSNGAMVELDMALSLGLRVLNYDEDLSV